MTGHNFGRVARNEYMEDASEYREYIEYANTGNQHPAFRRRIMQDHGSSKPIPHPKERAEDGTGCILGDIVIQMGLSLVLEALMPPRKSLSVDSEVLC